MHHQKGCLNNISLLDIAVLAALSLTGYLGNTVKLEIFHNVEFLFGSIAAMYAVKRYGMLGVIPAFIASLYTYTLWNHPYAVIILTTEAVFAAYLRRRIQDIIVLDLLYWLTVGAGLVYISYHFIIGLPQEASLLIILKQSVNGILNALFAAIIYYTLNYAKKALGFGFIRISFRRTFFKIIMLIASVPALVYIIFGVKMQTDELANEFKDNVNSVYNMTSISLNTLSDDAFTKINLLADMAADYENTNLKSHMQAVLASSETFMGLGYLDSQAKGVHIFNRINNEIKYIEGGDFSDRPIYKLLSDKDIVYVSNVLPSKLRKVQSNVILVIKPVRDSKGKLSGFIQGGMDFNKVRELMSAVSRDSGVTLTLTDKLGKVMISTANDKESGSVLKIPENASASDFDSRGVYLLNPCPADNVSVLSRWKNAYYIKQGVLGKTGLTLTAQLPLSGHINSINYAGFQALKIIYCVIILCVAAALLLSRQISLHLENLRQYSKELPSKVHTGERYAEVNSVFSEVSELSENFSKISEMLSKKFSELSRKKSELSLILDSIPLIIFMKDISNNLITGNKTAADKLGISESFFAGQNIRNLFPRFSDDIFENDTKVLESKKPLIGVIQQYQTHDRTIIVKTDKIPIMDENGNVASILVISRDITEELRAQEEKQRTLDTLYQQSKMAEMGAMTAAIAHQWKQPLNTIALITQLMQADMEEGILTAVSAEASLSMIMKNVDFMSQTADDFTEFFKTDKTKQLFKACETIPEIYSLIEFQFRKLGISVSIADHEHFLVFGNKNKFKQVCLNIMINAKDALSESRTEVKQINVSYGKTEGFITISIEDNGGGIPQELLPDRLFDMFRTSKGEKGTGIGLYICKTIIEEHMKGRITAENTDCGAKITIFLPIDQSITKEI